MTISIIVDEAAIKNKKMCYPIPSSMQGKARLFRMLIGSRMLWSKPCFLALLSSAEHSLASLQVLVTRGNWGAGTLPGQVPPSASHARVLGMLAGEPAALRTMAYNMIREWNWTA